MKLNPLERLMSDESWHGARRSLWNLYRFLSSLRAISGDYNIGKGGETTIRQDEKFVDRFSNAKRDEYEL
jgi:hypothetical protein